MAGLRALFVQRDGSNNGTVPKGARLALGGLLAPGTTDPLSVRTGVLVDGMGPVVVGTGAMSYQVRPFVGVTKYSDSNGPTVAANDGPVTVTTTPAPGANSRIDRVWMIQRLITGDGGAGTVNVFEFGVTQGNVAASPTPPTSIPAGAVALADFTVTAGVTSTASLTAERRHEWTVANGGIIPAGERRGRFWDGSGWRDLAATDEGGITVATQWTPQTTSPLGWIRTVGETRLFGSMNYTSNLPASGSVTLNGIPAPAYRWSGVLRNGGSVVTAELGVDRVLSWATRVGSATSVALSLDGIGYRSATT